MKEQELRQCCTCALCGGPIGRARLPIFFRLTVESHALDGEAVLRQHGLALAMGGNGALAMAMGPDEEMTREAAPPFTITVCADCYVGQGLGTTAELVERFGRETG
jgi:hypothetical protein